MVKLGIHMFCCAIGVTILEITIFAGWLMGLRALGSSASTTDLTKLLL
jgi:hypothetical protein